MLTKLKDMGWGMLGILIPVVGIVVFVFFIRGGVWLVRNFIDSFEIINGWVFIVIITLIILSVIPRMRLITGTGIYYGTFIWGVLFWLFSLFITYEMWGVLGIFIGLIFFGLGVFVTAFLALLFDGQWAGALLMALNLLIIYGVRLLGYWIASKYRTPSLVGEDDELINNH